jgi:hypothetical protein
MDLPGGKRALRLGDGLLERTPSAPSVFALQAERIEAATDNRVVAMRVFGMRNHDGERQYADLVAALLAPGVVNTSFATHHGLWRWISERRGAAQGGHLPCVPTLVLQTVRSYWK